MSFKADLKPRTRPDRVKPPPRPASPTATLPVPPSWATSHKRRSSSDSSHSSSTSSETEVFHTARFPPSEEAALLATSHTIKADANKQFANAEYSQAISTYDRALAECPNYLEYEIAVLQSNIAACHLKLSEWKEAIEASTRGLDGLDRLDPPPKEKKKTKNETEGDPKDTEETTEDNDDDDAVIELPSDTEDDNLALQSLALSDARKNDILRIRTKLLLRRARARSSLCLNPAAPSPETKTSSFSTSTWSTLTASLEDYTLLSRPPLFPLLPKPDQRTVTTALRELPPRIEAAKGKEMAEMMGKLKELGNGILQPFGLSTDMFKMNQDPGTGGYSMSFEGGGGKKG